MHQNAIQGAKRRGKPWRTTKADPTALRSPDRVNRDFTASRPDEKWFADFTYLRCWEGLVFFSFVIDAYSRMIVGWQFASHMRADLVLDALRMALHQRATAGADISLVAHSDAGSQLSPSNTHRSTTPSSLTTTTCSPRSAQSATPTTTQPPRASSTPSRPSSSHSAAGDSACQRNTRTARRSPAARWDHPTRAAPYVRLAAVRARGVTTLRHQPARARNPSPYARNLRTPDEPTRRRACPPTRPGRGTPPTRRSADPHVPMKRAAVHAVQYSASRCTIFGSGPRG
jgi:hypothetical protein